jgi:hypothetical protein
VHRLCVAVVLLLWALPVHADKIQDLCKALTQDPSYKVRVQAALVLGKLADRRAIDSLKLALKDENESVRGVAATSLGRLGDPAAVSALTEATRDSSEFVRSQAKKALDSIAHGGGGDHGGHVSISVGFTGRGPGLDILRAALGRELGKLPNVTIEAGSGKRSFIVDGQIQRLSAGGGQVDCDVKAFVATYPEKSIKMLTTEGASLQASGAETENAKRECLNAAAEAVRDDVSKFLRTLQ